jgi:hypothetical protein
MPIRDFARRPHRGTAGLADPTAYDTDAGNANGLRTMTPVGSLTFFDTGATVSCLMGVEQRAGTDVEHRS